MNTNCPTVPSVHKFTEVPVSHDKQMNPTSIKTLPHCAYSCSSFLKLYNSWWKRQNRHYHQYLDTLDEERSPLPDVTVQEMCLFLAIIVQMGHNQRGHAERLLVDTRRVFHSLLWKHYEMRHSLLYT